MGEHVKYRGETRKLGTCEDLYYVRYADLERMVTDGDLTHCDGNLPPAEYLTGSFRYRFPFPDEDQLGPFQYDNYSRGLVINITEEAELLDGLEHERCSTSLHPRDGHHYNVSVFFPCPQSPEFDPEQSSGIDWRIIELVQQRRIGDQLWSIVRCPYCGALGRLDAGGAALLAQALERQGGGYALEVARRIMAGYGQVDALDVDPLDTLPVVCPACGDDRAVSMGRLGHLHWFRCVACGIDFNLPEFEVRT